MLNYGAPFCFTEIADFAKQTVALLLGQYCDRLFAIFLVSCKQLSDISYIAESVASWEKKSGSMAKLWASNIRFGYCTILIVT